MERNIFRINFLKTIYYITKVLLPPWFLSHDKNIVNVDCTNFCVEKAMIKRKRIVSDVKNSSGAVIFNNVKGRNTSSDCLLEEADFLMHILEKCIREGDRAEKQSAVYWAPA